MKNIYIFIILVGSIFILYHYIQYLKATRGTESYAKRRTITLLFLAFVSLVGFSSIIAEAIFEFLGLVKPLYFELISLVAYTLFCIAAVLIMRGTNNSKNIYKNVAQHHSGKGDNVAGDKVINS